MLSHEKSFYFSDFLHFMIYSNNLLSEQQVNDVDCNDLSGKKYSFRIFFCYKNMFSLEASIIVVRGSIRSVHHINDYRKQF